MQVTKFTHDVLEVQVVISAQQELAKHCEQGVSLDEDVQSTAVPVLPPVPPLPPLPPLPDEELQLALQ